MIALSVAGTWADRGFIIAPGPKPDLLEVVIATWEMTKKENCDVCN